MKPILLVIAMVLAASAAGKEARSVQTGVYTAEQAERGAKLFGETCLACHQPEEFSEGAYLDGWEGQKMSDMIELIRSTMPQDNPGSLKRSDYVDLGTYLLSINGVPQGETEMDASSAQEIIIEGPFKAPGDGK